MNINNIQTPALIFDLDAYEENERIAKELLAGTNVKLRPHYKSHKCTTIAHMQLRAGAKGITCSKISEAIDVVEAGVEDVLIANQVVAKNKVALAAHLAKCCRLTLCVDQEQNIKDLSDAAVYEGSTIYCLVEYEIGMHRCGVDTPEAVYALAKQIEAAPNLVFEGIQAYAGHLSHEADYDTRMAESDKLENRLRELLSYLKERGVAVKEVSGVSTGTVQFRRQDTVYTEVQPGSYIFMDAAYDHLNLKFKHSLFVLSTVISVTETSVMTDAGRKTVSVDQEFPRILEAPGVQLRVSEEHITLPKDALDVHVGDRVRVIPGHCCTTMNLHDYVYFVRGEKVVDKVSITSRGKSI